MISLLQLLQLVQLLQFLFVIRENFWQIVVSYNFFVNFFSRSGWSVGQCDQKGRGGQSCQNIRWSGWLGWVIRVVNLILVVRGQGSQSG